MQAAVDFNGSKINNGTSITTTLTTEIGSTNQTPSANKQHSTKTTKATVLINEPPNVLRQRVQSHDTYASVTLTTIKAIALTPTTTTKNFACKNNEDEIQRLQPFESSAEYMGSNVQQMAVTPTSSPRASPTNTSEKDIESTLDVIVTDIGSDSNASSLTNSSNSSVLATPILMRGHEKTKVLTSSCCMRNSTGSNRKISELSNNVCSGCDHNEISRRQQPPKTLPLPLTTGSCVFRDFELTTPYTSSSASSTSTSKSLQSVTSSSASKATAPIEAQLLQWKDMPQYLQFNPYVLNGYRPLQTFRGCLLSLFCWHNETVNILTHGDAGYPLENFLMTPFRNAVSGSQESQFNTVHASARNIVERTIGVLKNTFRCLLSVRGLHYSPKKATQITGVCCALHNVNKALKTEFPEEPIGLVESDEFNDSEHISDSNATIAREIRINLMRNICNQ